MLTLNSNILKIGNKWIIPVNSGGVVPPEPPEPPEYEEYWLAVTTGSSHKPICVNHGMINGHNSGNALDGLYYNPDTGEGTLSGTYLRLGGTVPQEYAGYNDAMHISIQLNVTEALTSLSFSVYVEAAATITLFGYNASTGKQYQLARATIGASSGSYVYQNVTMDLSGTVYNITCTDDGNGTLSSDLAGGITGSLAGLTATPDTSYSFDSYTIVSGTGASISGNILTIGTSDVTVRANFAAPASGYDHYEVRFTGTSDPGQVCIWGINTRPDSGYTYDNWNQRSNLSSSQLDKMESTSSGCDISMTNTQYLSLTFSYITGGVLTWYDSLNEWFTPAGSNTTATLYGVDSLGNMTQLDQIGPYTNTYNVQRSLSTV